MWTTCLGHFYVCEDGWHEDWCHNDWEYDIYHGKIFYLKQNNRSITKINKLSAYAIIKPELSLTWPFFSLSCRVSCSESASSCSGHDFSWTDLGMYVCTYILITWPILHTTDLIWSDLSLTRFYPVLPSNWPDLPFRSLILLLSGLTICLPNFHYKATAIPGQLIFAFLAILIEIKLWTLSEVVPCFPVTRAHVLEQSHTSWLVETCDAA